MRRYYIEILKCILLLEYNKTAPSLQNKTSNTPELNKRSNFKWFTSLFTDYSNKLEKVNGILKCA